MVVLGGSKVSDKLGVIDNLIDKADALLIGGGMVFTFLAAQGHNVGTSLLGVRPDRRGQAVHRRRPRPRASTSCCRRTSSSRQEFSADAPHRPSSTPMRCQTARWAWTSARRRPRTSPTACETAKTVFWNGPMGVFEFAAFAAGTKAVAEALTEVDGLSVVGGGDSAAAIRALGFDDDQFGHISTGGGASLEYLEGKTLPGLEVLA